jgi:hypothetical protein
LGWLLLSAFLALRLGAGGYLRTMLHRTDHLKKPTLGICAVLR